MARKPIIAVTMGDPAGIGPEIILKALADPIIKKVCQAAYSGRLGGFAADAWKGKTNSSKLVCWQPGQRCCRCSKAHTPGLSVRFRRCRKRFTPRCPTKAAGHGAFSYIVVAAKLALSNVADAIATAPLSKNILIDAGYNYPGHTELLGELSGTPECRMMLIGDKLRVVPVTGHIAFTKVARSLNREIFTRLLS